MKLMKATALLFCSVLLAAGVQAETVTLHSDSGDTLMIHRLDNGEFWGSFMITDRIADSFADHELIVMQVDQHQPIKLDYQKQCGGGARVPQQVSYNFETEISGEGWLFSRVETGETDFLKLAGWDREQYVHMRSDRRPEVVDFPIQAELAIDGLLRQFQQGYHVVFRYVTGSGEIRKAVFDIGDRRSMLNGLWQETFTAHQREGR